MSDSDQPPLPPLRDGSSPPPYVPSKRSRDDESSSDVPFFSSDDLEDASLAKSTTPRRRKQYRRAWFEDEDPAQAHSHRLMRALTRKPKDSGVFLSSDSSNSSSDDGFNIHAPAFKKPENRKMFAFPPTRPDDTREPEPVPIVSRDDGIVEGMVRKCLDECNESVDLNNLGLKQITTSALGALQQMIRPPTFDKNPHFEGAFSPLTPQLKIFLSANGLQQIPLELFELKNLTVLSLRNNELKELSPAIRNCTSLQELNIASNLLQWLPFDMLSLLLNPDVHIESLRVRPNPLLKPYPLTRSLPLGYPPNPDIPTLEHYLSKLKEEQKEEQEESHRDDDGLECYVEWLLELIKAGENRRNRLAHAGVNRDGPDSQRILSAPIYLAMTPLALFLSDGAPILQGTTPPSSMPADQQYLLPVENEDRGRASARIEVNQNAPSLFELCLRTCAASGQLPEIASMLPADETPTPVYNGVRAAEAAVKEGPRLCGFCRKPYVIPRGEWIEYWGCCPQTAADRTPARVMDSVMPFLRRVCSWGCARAARSVGRDERNRMFMMEWFGDPREKANGV